jgi:tRNA(adenine34) deaminase
MGESYMWQELSHVWQEVFALAWEAYKKNTIPIGAVIIDDCGNIISRGRNRIFDRHSNNPLAGTYMAHAETTAMLNIKVVDHPKVNQYTLFTSMEPCPMCFGTMVMMGIKNLKYAARDSYAGATELNYKMDYIKNKEIAISKEGGELEKFQICLQASFEFVRKNVRMVEVLDSWRDYCSEGVLLAKKLHENGYFTEAKNKDKHIGVIYDEIINMLKLLGEE